MTTEQTATIEKISPTIQHAALNRAIAMLSAIGAEYAIVYDGQKHGSLELAPPAKVRLRGPGRYPRGATRAHFLPHLVGMHAGDTAKIPYGAFDVDILQSNIAAYCSSNWGAQNALVRRFSDLREIHVLRLS